MFRSRFAALTSFVLVVIPGAGWTYEIKSKTPESAFSGKQQPDIVGISSDVEGGKAGAIFDGYLKDLPGVKTQAMQQKFGSTNVTYVTSIKFDSPATPKHSGESMMSAFSSPASGNLAFYVARTLGFMSDSQPSKAEMIERVTKKYGMPTLIGDGHLYYFYKNGKVVSVKQKYDPKSALTALEAPIDPKAAVALNDVNGRGSCVAALKRAQALDKTLDKLADEAKRANCDGVVDVAFTSGNTPDRAGKAEFTLIDFKRIVSAAKIDADALAADKSQSNKSPLGSAPKL